MSQFEKSNGTPEGTHALWLTLLAFTLFFGCFEKRVIPINQTEDSLVLLPGLCVGITPPESMFLPLPVPAIDAGIVDVGESEVEDSGNQRPTDILAETDPDAEDSNGGNEIGDVIADTSANAADNGETSQRPPVDAGVTPAPGDAATQLVDASSDGSSDATGADDASGEDGQNSADSDAMGGGITIPPIDACLISPGTCIGEAAPEWALFDFQPQSCGYQATYGLKQFVGDVTVVVLLAAW